jgi:hypothetical protein
MSRAASTYISLQLSVETENPGIHLFMENRSGFHGNVSFV